MMKLLIQNYSSDDDWPIVEWGIRWGEGGGGEARAPPPPAQIGFYPILYVSYNMCSLYKMLAPPARIYDFFFLKHMQRPFFVREWFLYPMVIIWPKCVGVTPPPPPPPAKTKNILDPPLGMLTFPNYLKRVICDMVTSFWSSCATRALVWKPDW